MWVFIRYRGLVKSCYCCVIMGLYYGNVGPIPGLAKDQGISDSDSESSPASLTDILCVRTRSLQPNVLLNFNSVSPAPPHCALLQQFFNSDGR